MYVEDFCISELSLRMCAKCVMADKRLQMVMLLFLYEFKTTHFNRWNFYLNLLMNYQRIDVFGQLQNNYIIIISGVTNILFFDVWRSKMTLLWATMLLWWTNENKTKINKLYVASTNEYLYKHFTLIKILSYTYNNRLIFKGKWLSK